MGKLAEKRDFTTAKTQDGAKNDQNIAVAAM